MTLAISSHKTLVYVQLTPGGAFVEIAELGDVEYPELSRNSFDATVQNRNIDDRVLGVPRRGPMTIPLNFLPSDNTQDHLTGLQKLFWDNTITGWKIAPPNALPVWIMSGQVQNLKPKAPVDGKLALDVSIEFSGLMSIGGVSFGA